MPIRPALRSWQIQSPYTCRACLARLSRPAKCYSTAAPEETQPVKRHPAQQNKSKLPDGPARTRFAPSPTGYLHLGSLRTALFNYLLAKRTGGQFLLRIEDTDQKRTVPDAEERLYNDLRWAGLEWDEGPQVGGPYGPYRQSERTELYREHAEKLLESGSAYRCFCTVDRLNKLAEERAKLGLPTNYDRTCAHVPKEESDDRASRGEKYTVRLKAPDRYPKFKDLVYGNVVASFKELNQSKRADDAYDDPILLKSDGLPTYHLANVVDDHHMKITHVIRGTEWLTSTPKHLAMYNAFGWTPPAFAHVGLLVDETGNKLSKRNFDTDIDSFRKREIFPETLNNFVALLGWSHDKRSDVMSMKELEDNFTLKFTKGNATVSFGKLDFLQAKHIKRFIEEGGPRFDEMVDRVVTLIKADSSGQDELNQILRGRSLQDYVREIICQGGRNYTTAGGFMEHIDGFLKRLEAPADKLPWDPAWSERMQVIKDTYSKIPPEDWTANNLTSVTKELAETPHYSSQIIPPYKRASGWLYHELRVLLSGAKEGLGILHMMEILGKEECILRFERALKAKAEEVL